MTNKFNEKDFHINAFTRGEFKDTYHTKAEFDKKGNEHYIIAKKGDHIVDANIAQTLQDVLQAAGVHTLIPAQIKKTEPALCLSMSNCDIYLPKFILEQGDAGSAEFLPAQIITDNNIKITILDNTSLIDNLSPSTYHQTKEGYHTHYVHTYTNLLDMTSAQITKNHISQLEKESIKPKKMTYSMPPRFGEFVNNYKSQGENLLQEYLKRKKENMN